MDMVPGFMAENMIGERIVEMADRVLTMHKVVPGSEARDCFKLDGVEFEVLLRVKPARPRE